MRILRLILCLSVLATEVMAQDQRKPGEDYIWLSTKLTLGMPQNIVMGKLAQYYGTRKLDSSSTVEQDWLVINKEGPPWQAVRGVSFKDGKLSAASKEWGPQDQAKGVEFARSLFGAISELVKQGKKDCWLAIDQKEVPGAESKLAYIVCDDKYISFFILRSTDMASRGLPEVAGISESLGTPDALAIEKFIRNLKKRANENKGNQ